MKKKLKTVTYVIVIILMFWGILTIWAQYGGKQKSQSIGNKNSKRKALIIYNADPIYNLDEQICKSFAEGLSKNGFSSKITTVKLIKNTNSDYDLYVFCADTYNWAPNWNITNFIKSHKNLSGKKVIAITLGSGSTERSQRKLEEVLKEKKVNLLDSKSYWLLRPNDETRMKEKNTAVANDMAKTFGEKIGKQLNE